MSAQIASGFLVFVFITLQHFQITDVAGLPVTAGALAGALLLLLVRPRVGRNFLFAAVCVVLALSGIAGILAARHASLEDYLRTLALVVATLTVVSASRPSLRTAEILSSKAFARGIVAALVLVASINVAQVVTGSLGSEAFFNVFGDRQYLYNYQPRLDLYDVPRAQGFYLEPSYNAFVALTAGVVLATVRRYRVPALLLTAVVLVASQSAAGLLAFGALLAFIIVRSRKYAAALLPAGAIVAILMWSYLEVRLLAIVNPSTSGNYRLLAPLELLRDVLANSPLGYPLGSVEKVVEQAQIWNGPIIGTTLDNGLYLIVFYFGWFGVILIGLGVIAVGALALRTSDPTAGVVPLWILLSLGFSGGIFVPEFALSTWLVIVTYRTFNSKPEGASVDFSEPTTQRRDGDLRGSRGASADVEIA